MNDASIGLDPNDAITITTDGTNVHVWRAREGLVISACSNGDQDDITILIDESYGNGNILSISSQRGIDIAAAIKPWKKHCEEHRGCGFYRDEQLEEKARQFVAIVKGRRLNLEQTKLFADMLLDPLQSYISIASNDQDTAVFIREGGEFTKTSAVFPHGMHGSQAH